MIGPATPEPAGFFVSLMTESFAVRALVGSLAATGLAALVVRANVVRSTSGRRSVVLAPVVVAALAAIVSLLGTGGILAQDYLPRVWVTVPASASGQVLEVLGEVRVLAEDRGVDVLSLTWMIFVAVLIGRRLAGLRTVRRLLRESVVPAAGHPLEAAVTRARARLDAPNVSVRLLNSCPGGAFTTGVVRPVIVFDPTLLASLDAAEVEGLVAHEIAHVVRRDPLVAGVVGVVADLAFFLPTLAVAARWLAREQEHSADDLASAATRRPAALASSILKVWNRSAGVPQPVGACAAVPRLAAGPALTMPAPRLSDAARAVVARVERLVDPPVVTPLRRRVEVALVAASFATALAATFIVPSQIADRFDISALGLSYVPSPEPAVESPAFATFHALTPEAPLPSAIAPERLLALAPPAPAEAPVTCPCVETQAQLHNGDRPGRTSARVMRWRDTTTSLYDGDGPDAARPLWTLDSAPGVGFFALPSTADDAVTDVRPRTDRPTPAARR